jgi:hypothetical protein
LSSTTNKKKWAGKEMKLVNPYNTSQVCSECRQIVKKTLSKRISWCDCGYVADEMSMPKEISYIKSWVRSNTPISTVDPFSGMDDAIGDVGCHAR